MKPGLQPVVLITQARMGSSRLPGKVLMDVGGQSLLSLHLHRAGKAAGVDVKIVATSDQSADDPVAQEAERCGWAVFRGSEPDVLDRFYQAALPHEPNTIVRLTADCPLIDPALIELGLATFWEQQVDYLSTDIEFSYPNGFDLEVFSWAILEKAWEETTDPLSREHVTASFWDEKTFPFARTLSKAFLMGPGAHPNVRLTVDHPADLATVRAVVEALGPDLGWKAYADYLQTHPQLARQNQSHRPYEGYGSQP